MSGFLTRRRGNLLKSRSADQSSRTPWLRQSAATRASCTNGPCTFALPNSPRSSGQCISFSESRCSAGEASQASICALLAAPVRDTIKRGNAEHEAEASVPRENLWRAFTPQLFHRGELADALEAAIASGVAATDEAKALELRGKTALLVTGSDDNLKVTSAEDLAIAEMILRRQEDEA